LLCLLVVSATVLNNVGQLLTLSTHVADHT
jgi:hypothetical protein